MIRLLYKTHVCTRAMEKSHFTLALAEMDHIRALGSGACPRRRFPGNLFAFPTYLFPFAFFPCVLLQNRSGMRFYRRQESKNKPNRDILLKPFLQLPPRINTDVRGRAVREQHTGNDCSRPERRFQRRFETSGATQPISATYPKRIG